MKAQKIDTTTVNPPHESPTIHHFGFEPKLIEGYKFDETVSALQKCIRRGLEFDSVFFAAIIYKSGFSMYLARRLRIIAHEDIGIANPQALLLANQIYQDATYKRTDKKHEGAQSGTDGFLPYANLILFLCRSPKSRIADEVTNLAFDAIDKGDLRLTINNDFIDPHSDRGKMRFGRWNQGDRQARHDRMKLWFDRWSVLDNEIPYRELPNPYHDLVKQLWGYEKSDDVLLEGETHTNLLERLASVIGKVVGGSKYEHANDNDR